VKTLQVSSTKRFAHRLNAAAEKVYITRSDPVRVGVMRVGKEIEQTGNRLVRLGAFSCKTVGESYAAAISAQQIVHQ
jgi:hypothetical protein